MGLGLGLGLSAATQIGIWGYAVGGDVTQRDALLCEERRGGPLWHHLQTEVLRFDRTRQWLDNCVMVIDPRSRRRVPDWCALAWITDADREALIAEWLEVARA